MAYQFEKAFDERGAAMGRVTDGYGTKPTERLRLFRVQLDAGGYDNGGAYWGLGEPLYCAMSPNYDPQTSQGYRRFVRAASREMAAAKMGLNGTDLIRS